MSIYITATAEYIRAEVPISLMTALAESITAHIRAYGLTDVLVLSKVQANVAPAIVDDGFTISGTSHPKTAKCEIEGPHRIALCGYQKSSDPLAHLTDATGQPMYRLVQHPDGKSTVERRCDHT